MNYKIGRFIPTFNEDRFIVAIQGDDLVFYVDDTAMYLSGGHEHIQHKHIAIHENLFFFL